MVHFTCDLCGKDMTTSGDGRYVVKMEAYPGFDPNEIKEDDLDDDPMEAVSELLQRDEELSIGGPREDPDQGLPLRSLFGVPPQVRARPARQGNAAPVRLQQELSRGRATDGRRPPRRFGGRTRAGRQPVVIRRTSDSPLYRADEHEDVGDDRDGQKHGDGGDDLVAAVDVAGDLDHLLFADGGGGELVDRRPRRAPRGC